MVGGDLDAAVGAEDPTSHVNDTLTPCQGRDPHVSGSLSPQTGDLSLVPIADCFGTSAPRKRRHPSPEAGIVAADHSTAPGKKLKTMHTHLSVKNVNACRVIHAQNVFHCVLPMQIVNSALKTEKKKQTKKQHHQQPIGARIMSQCVLGRAGGKTQHAEDRPRGEGGVLALRETRHARFFSRPAGGANSPVKRQQIAAPLTRRRAVAMTTTTPVPELAPSAGVLTAPYLSPLSRCLDKWKMCNANPWVLRTVTQGYRLQFAMKPPMSTNVLPTRASGAAAVTLREEITSLLNKNAIRVVDVRKSPLGFYSRYFLVKKKGGGFRPILDLRALNRHLKVFNFKMLTAASLLLTLRQGDYWMKIDLKDAYFHIPIYPPHRKFLRFEFEGTVYEYTVLPFGMSLSPRVFVKCTQAALAPLRQKGIRVANYVDDYLLSASTAHEARAHCSIAVNHLTALGFTLNLEKCVFTPSRRATFIGIDLDSVSLRARLSQERVDSFLKCLSTFKLGHTVQYKTCMRASGLIASALALVRLGRLHFRPFQRWMRSLQIPATQGFRRVAVTAKCVQALQQWKDKSFLLEGVPMGRIISRKMITTDASLKGWGATLEGRTASGLWDLSLKKAHINYLELMAVFLALKHFRSLISGCHVLVRTDSTTTMSYVNKQGGLHSPVLDGLARRLVLWCDTHLASIRAIHVPGSLNSGADLLSRGVPRYSDWSLHPRVVDQIWARYGRPVVDLFASEENTKCPLFFSILGRAPLGVDALAHDWPRGLLYAFPPLEMIHSTLERVRLQSVTVLLVAPAWGSWRSEVTTPLHDYLWPLPLYRDLLQQARG